jgi:hypothetical protein
MLILKNIEKCWKMAVNFDVNYRRLIRHRLSNDATEFAIAEADIYTYIHTYMHTYIHSYIHTYIHTYIHRYGRATI